MNQATRGGRVAPVITEGYEIKQRNGGIKSILCLKCNMESYHPMDVEHRYCGRCHAFHAEKGGSEETVSA